MDILEGGFDMNTLVWLIGCIVLVVVEALTMNLTTIWFAIGALAAYLCGFVGAGFWGQFAVFVVISLVLLFFTKPMAQKYLNKDRTKTNAESLVGKVARTTSRLDNREGFGTAIVGGQEWSAISSDDAIVIEADQDVEILEVRGVKLVVRTMVSKWEPKV